MVDIYQVSNVPECPEYLSENTPQSRLICSLRNGAPIKPEVLWTMMNQLRKRIALMLGAIDNCAEKEKI